MKRIQIHSTTPFSSQKAQLLLAVMALVTVYYRLPLLFFLLILYLSYLLGNYFWVLASCRSARFKSSPLPESLFTGDTFNRDFQLFNSWFLPLAYCELSLRLPSQFACQSTNKSCAFVSEFSSLGNAAASGANGVGTGKLHGQETYTFRYIEKSAASALSSTMPLGFDEDNAAPSGFVHESKDSAVVSDTISGDIMLPSWIDYSMSYAWLPEKKEITVSLQLKANLRGSYYLPAPRIYVGDPAGLFRGLTHIGPEHYLYVFPRLSSAASLLKTLAFEENQREDEFGLDDHYQIQGVRDYQPGDPLKSINWYATARTNSLKTNLYQRENSENCLVVLDLSVSLHPYYNPETARLQDDLLEQAISQAAGIALYHLEQGIKTAFFTNAPLIRWEKSSSTPDTTPCMKRVRKISTLDFAVGNRQAQDILKLCATIDETSRAYPHEQEKLWLKIQEAPANTLIYLLCYHQHPASWEKPSEHGIQWLTPDPATFYSKERLATLSSSRVRLLNLSREGSIK